LYALDALVFSAVVHRLNLGMMAVSNRASEDYERCRLVMNSQKSFMAA
jgi:hypothetical protein